MDICCNTSCMDTNGNLAIAVRCHDRSDLGKLQFLLCLSHCKYLLLPFVIGLLANSFFLAPGLYAQATVSAL